MHKTGDINKNIEKLKMELKQIRYPEKTDFDSLTTGNPLLFLPIVHYTLLSYSKFVAQYLHDNDYELFSKNDFDFLSNVFHAIINLFHFKPTLSHKQFFSNGFAEGKVLFCIDLIRVVKQEHSHLVKKAYSQSGKNIHKSPAKTDKNCHGERSPDRRNYEQNTDGRVNNTTGNDEVKENNFIKNIKVINNRNDQMLEVSDNLTGVTSPKFNDDIEISYKRSSFNAKENIIGNQKKFNEVEMSQPQKTPGIDFSTLVEIINTLANSVKEMTGKVEAFKTNIEGRIGKIEDEMALMKNRLNILETSGNCPIQNTSKHNENKLSESPSNKNSNEFNDHIFSFATEDVNSNSLNTGPFKEIHTAEYGDNSNSNSTSRERMNNQNCQGQTMKKQESKDKAASFHKNTNKILSEIEETDSLIERVEKRFKETQKLLNEIK